MRSEQTLFEKIWDILFGSGGTDAIGEDKESLEVIDRMYDIVSKPEPEYDVMWNRLEHRLGQKRRRVMFFRKAVACAVLLLSTSGMAYFILQRNVSNPPVIATARPLPEGVTLTLPGGHVIGLGKQEPGEVLDVLESDVLLTGQDSMATVREKSSVKGREQLVYNVIDVPIAAEYRLTLPDGTKVFLNAASRLRYPLAFGSDERRVFLEGEGYFEVFRDREHPFRVEVDGMEVEALGTAFNVNAYGDNGNIQTTLVEGKVAVSGDAGRVVLAPGEQAVYDEDSIRVREVDFNEFIGWKDGLFVFNSMSLEDIMQQMRRWYGIEVFFVKEAFKHYTFTGMIDRNLPAEETFRVIEKTVAIHFDVKGKTVIIN